MYVPDHFKENDVQVLQQYIRDYGFGVLVVADEEGIEANHLPFHLQANSDSGILQCHVARNNPVWQRIEKGAQVLVIFQGPDAYISPSWYPSKAETGRVVPTWNYLAVHAEGVVRIFQEPADLRAHLQNLTNLHEAERKPVWSVDDAPRDFTDNLMRGIVGIEIKIEKLTGKLKASQNQPERNRAGVKSGLVREAEAKGVALSKFIA
jgi:transcriptional regulator